jgi:hypothetical protein
MQLLEMTSAVVAKGFDPITGCPDLPFLSADNRLNVGYELGLVPNRLDDIEILDARTDKKYFQRRRQWIKAIIRNHFHVEIS